MTSSKYVPSSSLPFEHSINSGIRGWEVQLRWILAHKKILGNDIADEAAKEATGYIITARTITDQPPEPEDLQILTTTTKHTIGQTMKNEWKQSWETAKHGRELFKLGVRPGKGTLKTHNGTHLG